MYQLALPQQLIDKETTRILEEMEARKRRESGTETECTSEDRQLAKQRAEEQVELFIIMEKIAEDNSIEPSQEEVQERLERIVKETSESKKKVYDEYHTRIYQGLKRSKTIDYLIDHAKVVVSD